MLGSSVDQTNIDFNNLKCDLSYFELNHSMVYANKMASTSEVDSDEITDSEIGSNKKRLKLDTNEAINDFICDTPSLVNNNNNDNNKKLVKPGIMDSMRPKTPESEIEEIISIDNKRFTKDKTYPNRVFSLKINRMHFRIKKLKWNIKRQPIKKISTNYLQYNNKKLNNLPNLNKSDEIRNAIKQQLNILRSSKKTVGEQIELEVVDLHDSMLEHKNVDSVAIKDAEVVNEVSNSFNSLHEIGENKCEGNSSESDVNVAKEPYEMTNILFEREAKGHTVGIKLSKTNDITKIKGWKKKVFIVAEQPPIPSPFSILNTIENPIPSTSYSYRNEVKPRAVYEPVKVDNVLKQGEISSDGSKSAFLSHELDSYLTNHSELKISYEVPKLVAQEAISIPETVIPAVKTEPVPFKRRNVSNKRKLDNNYKPKTLAEKRRMLEKEKINETSKKVEVTHELKTTEQQCKYDKNNKKLEELKKFQSQLLNTSSAFTRFHWHLLTNHEDAKQYCIYNKKKLRIFGSTGGDVIAIPKENLIHFSKAVTYKPGPLSKKPQLIQNLNPNQVWESKLLTMPKIKLVVKPELGKRLPILAERYLQLHRGEKGIISDTLANFAVSAVQSSKKNTESFEFEIPYKNHQNLVLARRLVNKHVSKELPEVPVVNFSEYKNVNVENCIKKMMSEMLTSLENLELDKFIIKDDPDLNYNKEDRDLNRSISPIDSRVQAIIKRPNVKRSKTTLELRRLNVQVIEVDVEDGGDHLKECNNDFCKLGCVCCSLRSSHTISNHCRKESCMLECSCNFSSNQTVHHSISLPAGTDLLSASTVVRLQDEAKRNLAKEEREFAQTVIKANNQTIMVGAGVRERNRRVPKVPKKYSNYVQPSRSLSHDKNELDDDDDFKPFQPFVTTNTKITSDSDSSIIIEDSLDSKKSDNLENMEIVKKDEPIKILDPKKLFPIWKKPQKPLLIHNKKNKPNTSCNVKLVKLNLDKIIPWCMFHNLYKCYCKGKAPAAIEPKVEKKTPQPSNSKPELKPTIKTNDEQMIIEIDDSEDLLEPTSFKPVTSDDCVQTGPIRYISKTLNPITEIKPQKIQVIKQVEKQPSNKCNGDETVSINTNGNNLMKNKIRIVNIDDILKGKSSEATKSLQNMPDTAFIDYERSYVGLLTPSGEWLQKLHRMLNLNTNSIIRQIRLLEWATLVTRYNDSQLQVWFSNKKNNNIVLTEDRRRPSKSHMNVRLFQSTDKDILEQFCCPDIITSLLLNKLPGEGKKANEIFVILVFSGVWWEARGTIILNSTFQMSNSMLMNRKTPKFLLNQTLNEANANEELLNDIDTILEKIPYNVYKKMQPKLLPKPQPEIQPKPQQNEPVKVPNKPKIMSVGNDIEIRKVVPQSIKSELTQHILVPLPLGHKFRRWFVLVLHNDFNLLRIKDVYFQIKYTSLSAAIVSANKNMKPVRIRSEVSKQGDLVPSYGIFAIPNFNDRIFFGPYDDNSPHGLDTYRYVNQKLVNTKVYYKMVGNVNKYSYGIWYNQTKIINNLMYLEPQQEENVSVSSSTNTVPQKKKIADVIDLTENDSDSENPPQSNDVLSANFSKKVPTDDVTIKPIHSQLKVNLPQKRKSLSNLQIDPIKKIKPDITIMDDEDQTVIRKKTSFSTSILKRNNFQKLMICYITTNIPNLGYFKVYIENDCKGTLVMKLIILGKENCFGSRNSTVAFLHNLFLKYMCVVPKELTQKFYFDKVKPANMTMFDEKYLDGYHMMCPSGVFNLMEITTQFIFNLFSDEEHIITIIAHKCDLLITKSLSVWNSDQSQTQEELTKPATSKSQIQSLVKKLLEDAPVGIRQRMASRVYQMMLKKFLPNELNTSLELNNRSASIHPTKCKIVNGKVVYVDSKTATQHEAGSLLTIVPQSVNMKNIFPAKKAESVLKIDLTKD